MKINNKVILGSFALILALVQNIAVYPMANKNSDFKITNKSDRDYYYVFLEESKIAPNDLKAIGKEINENPIIKIAPDETIGDFKVNGQAQHYLFVTQVNSPQGIYGELYVLPKGKHIIAAIDKNGDLKLSGMFKKEIERFGHYYRYAPIYGHIAE